MVILRLELNTMGTQESYLDVICAYIRRARYRDNQKEWKPDPEGHTGDVYHRMWNQKINKHSETRDTIWLDHIFFKEKVEDSKNESNSHGKVLVNPDHTSEERREDKGSDNLSDSSSVVDGKTKDKGWLRYAIRASPLDEADIFAKILHGSVFQNFAETLIGKNEYVHSCY